MRKLLLYVVVLTAAMLVPLEKSDIGQLIPVEVVLLSKEGGRVVIETDTENLGAGKTVSDAIEDLKETAAGVIYLDTAEYLLLREDTVELIPELKEYLKPGTKVCVAMGEMDLEMAAQYLAVHQPSCELKNQDENWKMEILTKENNSMKLSKN